MENINYIIRKGELISRTIELDDLFCQTDYLNTNKIKSISRKIIYPEYHHTNNTATSTSSYYLKWGDLTSSTSPYNFWVNIPQSPEDRIREIIRARQAPMVHALCRASRSKDNRELRARETLLRLVGTEQFRNFIKKGFISVKAKSGRYYQIFAGHNFTRVWEAGKFIQQLCVVLSGDFTPTDSLIMRYVLLLNDEQDFWSRANKHNAYTQPTIPEVNTEQKTLLELWKELKRAA